jgi:predicted SAM-dependent methyltransferase
MITIFSIPKAFKGHIDIIQRNALKSWTKLGSGCEVLLFGDDEGVAEAAEELGVKHVSDIEKNEHGTPLLDFVFDKAQQIAKHDKLCYVNADIILLNDIVEAVKQVNFDKYLIVGQRWDVDIEESLDYQSDDWEKSLRGFIESHGQIHPPSGSDYFIFPKGVLGQFPPFAVGRPGWDTWVIYRGRKIGIPVIDISPAVTVIHQNHDYKHVPGGDGKDWRGPEGDTNIDLIGGWDYVFTLRDTNWILNACGVKKRQWKWSHLARSLSRLFVLYPALSPIGSVAGLLLKIARSVKFNVVHLKIKWSAKRSPVRIVVGSSGFYPKGWTPTDVDHVNLLNEGSFKRYFAEDSIDAILAEHVLEHLTLEEGRLSAKNCFKFLKKGGYLRVAVPDGLHPSPKYIDAVKKGGNGPGSDDHKILYNYKTFSEIFCKAGFVVELLEWFDEKGDFNLKEWDKDAGMIHRSKRYDQRNEDGQLNYTSIILDAIKR